jgi:hypothetical protein
MFTKKTESSELKTRREAAEQTAAAVLTAEASLIKAMGDLQDVKNRVGSLATHRETLRQKVRDLLNEGQVTEAEKTGKLIGDASGALEVAEINANLFAENVEAREQDLIRAEEDALTAFQAVHAHQHDAMRAQLVEEVATRWRSAWKHALAAGNTITFSDWLKAVAHDGHVNVADEHLPAVDLSGLPPHPTQAQSVGHVARRQMKDRIWQRANG